MVDDAPVGSLPGNHPQAMKTELTRMEMLERLDGMTQAELAQVIEEQQKVMAEAKAIVDRAKTISKSKRTTAGLEVYDDVAMVFAEDKKFDAPTAVRALTKEQLRKICVLKPDATMAKKVFGEHSELYKACQKDNGFKLTVREATDADRLTVLAMSNPFQAEDADEVLELDSF
jgi:hypothetical protein